MGFINEKEMDYHVYDILMKTYPEKKGFKIEAEKTRNKEIQKILNHSSKAQNGNAGKPEFIITNNKWPNFCIIVEDKNKTKNEKKSINEAIWYSINLSSNFNVLAIGITGMDDKTFSFQHAMFIKGKKGYIDLPKSSKPVNWNNILSKHKEATTGNLINQAELNSISRSINQSLRDNLALPELNRPILVSVILTCLTDEIFISTYTKFKDTNRLCNFIYSSFLRVLEEKGLDSRKIKAIAITASFAQSIKGRKNDNSKLLEIIDILRSKVINDFNIIEFDVVGHFYESFIKFSTNGGGDLGINLTPNHIAQLMYKLIDGKVDDIIFDPTMGTGTFLSVHWKNIYRKLAKNDQIKLKKLQHHSTVGIELDDNMYTLALMNMILHHDGFNNLYMGNCFDKNNLSLSQKSNPNKLLMNPPYGQKVNELKFTNNALKVVQKGGLAAVIFPLSVLRDSKENNLLKKQLLDNNSIIASIEMSNDIFETVNTHTCILVIRVGIPHDFSKKVWFSKFDDKYKTYNKAGRLPTSESELAIKNFVDNYFAKEETNYSFNKKISSHKDHFIFSSFLDKFTKPDDIHKEIFEMGKKILVNDLEKNNFNIEQVKTKINYIKHTDKKYRVFNIKDLFNISRGKRWRAMDRVFSIGDFPFITATNENNGIAETVDKKDVKIIFNKRSITLNVFGHAFIQNQAFSADDNVAILTPKKDLSYQEMVFYVAALKYLKVIHKYGYKLQNQKLINEINFNLPVNSEGKIDKSYIIKIVDRIISKNKK